MKLQINDSSTGAWRNLINFHAHDLEDVMKYAGSLMQVQTGITSMQIIDADHKVIASLPHDGPVEQGWV